jgi:hypothetical protein
MGDSVKFMLDSTFAPIPLQGLLQPTGQPYSRVDTLYSVIGYPKAAAWTGRTDIENRIVETYHRLNPTVKTEEQAKFTAAYESLRAGGNSKDPATVAKARAQLKTFGAQDSAKNNVIHQSNVFYPHYAFQRLPANEQKKILDRMSEDERKEYLKGAHKKLREGYHP